MALKNNAEFQHYRDMADRDNMGPNIREMNSRVEQMNTKLDNLTSQINGTNTSLKDLNAKIDNTNTNLNEVVAEVKRGSWKSTATLVVAILTLFASIVAFFF